ncbi:MAG: hypothetical protein KI792_10465 [Alphaproteobacteria bacterium]|nr:hypothetical protein [Alphaproteobacteria bacterium SS10]
MSQDLRTALQALDRELDRLQANAKQQAARELAREQEPAADPALKDDLSALKLRVDAGIAKVEDLLKEAANG